MQASRRSVNVVAAASPSWFPGNPEATAPHLSGVDLPGMLSQKQIRPKLPNLARRRLQVDLI